MSTAFCFDLDGTITKQEILPLIAREIDLFQEMDALTTATINGVIPFDSSFKLRCKILSDIPISQVRKIVSNIKMYDELVQFIRDNKHQCFILTGNLDIWVEDLLAKLGCAAYTSKAIYEGDRLKQVGDILHKGDAVDVIRTKGFGKIVTIGDGMGDVNMFSRSDVSIAFGATHKPIQTLIEYSNFVIYNEKALCRTLNTLL